MRARSRLGLPADLRARGRALWKRLRGGELSRSRATASVALGLFIGCLPLYGLHFALCAAICLPLRLDLIVAYLAANVSNPLFAPFLLTIEIEVGSLLLTGRTLGFDVERARQVGLSGFIRQAALGSLVVASALSLLGGTLTWLITARRLRPSELERALGRAVARYAQAPIADRLYVGIKLRTDPLSAQLASIDGSLGHVLDLGCGRGQFALLLLELGRATQITGFDYDARKIAVAQSAAAGSASFSVGDALELPVTEPDTVLLIDVLHYLDPESQDGLLRRLARTLAPGGQIVIRDLDRRRGLRSRVTQLLERWATRLGYNRGSSLHFRPAHELVSVLRGAGLECNDVAASTLAPLGNVLVIARSPVAPAAPAPASRPGTKLDDHVRVTE